MIETGLWRGLISHDCSTNPALGFPGPQVLVHPLCLVCGCHRELQAPFGSPAAAGVAALPSTWPESKFSEFGVQFHTPRVVPRQPLGRGGDGSPGFAGPCDAHPRLAPALWALRCGNAALSAAAGPHCLLSSGTCSIWRGFGGIVARMITGVENLA